MKPVGKQPISRHPLFPATVALWFGALFGLGSMAIRPSLIEKAVLATQLQTIIPSVEPPLGATTQILLALTMAGFGGVLGALLGRWIGRPKATKFERRRDAASVANSASTRAHGFGQRSGGADHDDEAAGASTFRRRPLAVRQEIGPREYQERAPLPGGYPQLLDVTEFDLAGFEADRQESIQEFVSEANELTEFERLRDLAHGHAAPAPEAPGGVEVFGAIAEGGAPPFDEGSSDDRSRRQSGSEFEAHPHELAVEALEQRAPMEFGRHPVFAQADGQPEPEADFRNREHRDPVWPHEEYEHTGQAAPPCDGGPATPLFSKPAGDARDASQAIRDAVSAQGLEEPAASEAGVHTEGASDLPEAPFASDNHGDDEGEPVAFYHPAKTEAGEEIPAGDMRRDESRAKPEEDICAGATPLRIMSANLNELSHVELLERLALTLQRGRNRQAVTDLEPATDRLAQVEAAAAMTGSFDPHEPEDGAAPDFPAPTAADVANEPANDTIETSPHEPPEEVKVEAADQYFVSPPPPMIPAALRPIDLDDLGDADLPPSIVPPRHFSLAAPADKPPHQVDAGAVEDVEPDCSEAADARDDGEDDELSAEERELEAGYSSLLSMSRPDRPQFVRIEEPEADDGEIKPFVVFPNKGSAGPAPFAMPLASPESGPPSAAAVEAALPPAAKAEERRFDQPEIGKIAASDDSAPASQHDPEETERSLRAALATLQRMSGAA